MSKRVLILYTGGTFGMDPKLRVPKLKPEQLRAQFMRRVPELGELADCTVEIVFNLDSAHLGPSHWLELAAAVKTGWKTHDGIVILHGTDTLAYTASALSYLLRPCLKPVILTGAQKPLASIRTDARRNLIAAVEIAAHGPRPLLNQVGVFFDHRLWQGNRVRKRSALDFQAFDAPLSAPLAVVGTSIRYSESTAEGSAKSPSRGTRHALKQSPATEPRFNERVAMLHVTPGFPAQAITEGLLPRIDGLVLVVYPSGTAPTQDPEFLHLLRAARIKGVPIIAVGEGAAESPGEAAQIPVYAAAKAVLDQGAIWGGGMTPEAAYTKLGLALGQGWNGETLRKSLALNWAGERPET